MPYHVSLEDGDSCYAHLDHPALIRSAVDGEEVGWNARAQAMEVAASASLVIHPTSSRVVIGIWHDHAAAGVLYSVGMGQ